MDGPFETKPISQLISHFLLSSPIENHYSMTDGIVRRDRNIPLDDALKLAQQHPIWANRGKAIQSYAILEQSLSRALADLGDMARETAATIFYKITNTDSRRNILEKLLHKKYGTRFNAFWNAYLKELRYIDLKRNAIVHWLSVMYVALNTDNVMIIGIELIPPSYTGGEPSEHITSDDLTAFAQKCDVFGRLCGMFVSATSDKLMPDEIRSSWLEICQQPLVYPLPVGHPLLTAKGACS
jgi:hypothetical protein